MKSQLTTLILCMSLLFPVLMFSMSGHKVHGDFSGIGWRMTPGGVVAGFFGWSIIAGIITVLITQIYNKLV